MMQKLFFAEGRDVPGLPWLLLVPLAIFLITRFTVLEVYEIRGQWHLISDPGNYLRIAEYVRDHGKVPMSQDVDLRQFPGLSFLMIPVDAVLKDIVLSGYVVAWGGALGAIALFHGLFRQFRMTCLFVIFVPSWVACTSVIMAEGWTLLLWLLMFHAIRDREYGLMQIGLLLVAGYVHVVRNTAIFLTFPFLIGYAICLADRWSPAWWGRLCAWCAALSVAPTLYLAFNYWTIGVLLPQITNYQDQFSRMNYGNFPGGVLGWPGYSVLHGLLHPNIAVAKKLSVAAAVVLAAGTVVGLWHRLRRASSQKEAGVENGMLAASLAHLAFHLCLGSSPAFDSFDRFVSHLNVMICLVLVQGRKLRWPWILVAALIGTLFASFTGRGAQAILPWLKPESM